MRTIYKYEFVIEDGDQHAMIHEHFRLVHVGMQHHHICLWAEVDTANVKVAARFRVVGTGHDYPTGDWDALGSVFHGPFVWHLLHAS